jgi:hypothetical protein
MADDILVILQQDLGRKMRQIVELCGQGVVKVMDIIFIQPLIRFIPDYFGE